MRARTTSPRNLFQRFYFARGVQHAHKNIATRVRVTRKRTHYTGRARVRHEFIVTFRVLCFGYLRSAVVGRHRRAVSHTLGPFARAIPPLTPIRLCIPQPRVREHWLSTLLAVSPYTMSCRTGDGGEGPLRQRVKDSSRYWKIADPELDFNNR